tara:strand:- start:40753 stop:40911 length:159 start_codon:yes stop_codon:yes gene_type:complete
MKAAKTNLDNRKKTNKTVFKATGGGKLYASMDETSPIVLISHGLVPKHELAG